MQTPLVSIRQATPGDAQAIASVNVSAWKATYRGIMPDDVLKRLDPAVASAKWAKRIEIAPEQIFVASHGSNVVGYCSMSPSRDDDAQPHAAELQTLYVDPILWRTGIGSQLLATAESTLKNRAFASLSLWVARENTPAILFYAARNFTADGPEKLIEIGGSPLREVRLVKSL